MKYGLPYKGSKNKLAERIVRLLPKRTHLVDLFCGGCAVSHAALLMGKYEHIHINDINWMCPTLFIDALNGKYNDETRWISREDFFRLKDTDPYVAVVWSFGNNLRDYLYSKEIEPLKKAIHYAMFFSDYSLGKELGHDLSFIDPIQDLQKRYLAVKRYFNKLDHFQQQSFEGGRINGCSQWKQWNDSIPISRIGGAEKTCADWRRWKDLQTSVRIATPGMYQPSVAIQKKKSQRRTMQLRKTQHSCIACNTESGSTVCPDFRGGQFLPITSSVLDYESVTIPEDSVIYCDIPYEDTNVYNKAEGFDYERFYQWCERQTQPVFISSYQMPTDRFDCIEEFAHRATLCATANNLVTERIYVPKHQTERGNRTVQLTLF
jgi:hypothetical protein